MILATKEWVLDLLKKFNKKKDNYSTEETQIGTWIDNKPLYRRVITVSTSQSSEEISYRKTDTSLKNISIKSFNGSFHLQASDSSIFDIGTNFYYSTNTHGNLAICTTTGYIEMKISSAFSNGKTQTGTIIIEYTK